MIDSDLMKSINSRRCIAFVGAGPSVELGYPSWSDLAKRVRDHVLENVTTADRLSYEVFMKKGNYPELLRQAEIDLGSRQTLINFIKTCLRPRSSRRPTRSIYDYLAKWPFACYLTTNFDDEISNALTRQGQHYQVRHNTVNDLSLLRDNVNHLIVKVHSDLDHHDLLVLTSVDYDRIMTAREGEYICQKLIQVFSMFDVFIIGHSMTDPDIQLILRTAKYTASALHPIHMLLANVTSGEIREFKEQFNIRLSTYESIDDAHDNLRRLIAVADKWICSRDAVSVPPLDVSEEEIDAAASLLLFQRLKDIGDSSSESVTMDSLLLFALASSTSPIPIESLIKRPALSSLAASADGIRAVDDSLTRLIKTSMVVRKAKAYAVTDIGKKRASEVTAQRKLEEDQAFGQFELAIRTQLPDASDDDCLSAKKALRNALVGAFRSRGIAMANVIIADQSLSADELSDLFGELSKHASNLADDSLRCAFLDAAHSFLIEPNHPQMAYLASLSQGFFLFHMAGMDPTCSRIRTGLFTNTYWFIDSSVLLPLLAIGCHNHDYAVDLFEKLKAANATLLTTEELIREVRAHLDWARSRPPESPDFHAAVTVQEGFRQNLFLDGYVRQSAEGVIGTFADYLAHVIPSGKPDEALAEVCQKYGISVLHAPNVEGFKSDHWGDIEAIKGELIAHRQKQGTFRGERQVDAEAEVLILIQNLRQGVYRIPGNIATLSGFYFISQSRVLDAVRKSDRIVTWTPEAVYRYVSSLPGQELQADLLQECMLHEYYYAGVSFVDKPRYFQYFGPNIRQAKISYREQIDNYLQQTEQTHRRNDYNDAFDSTPDLEKPFFVAQMGWDLARRKTEQAGTTKQRADRAVAQARDAEKRTKEAERIAESERKARITAEQTIATMRNQQDPGHLRKRAKQAKKRRRRKK